MANPIDPAAAKAWKAALRAWNLAGWQRRSDYHEMGALVVQAYGDQRVAQSADRIAELEARVAKLDLDLEAAQCLMDSQYMAGVKLGWHLCATDDEAGYQRVTSGTEHIAELKRIQAERAALNPSARSE